MALQFKIEVRRTHFDHQPIGGPHMRLEMLLTTYNDVTQAVVHQNVDALNIPWATLPANIRTKLTALGPDILAALQAYYGVADVTFITPGTQ